MCDSNLICYPDAASMAVSFFSNPFAELADGRWVDPHGCVQPNCEEGFECSPGQSQYFECVVGDPRADQFGCRPRRCDEPGGFDCETISDGFQWCAPDLPQANVQSGCAPKSCQSGYPCESGEVCDISNPAAARTGCVPAECVADPSSCAANGAGGAGVGGSSGSGAASGSATSDGGTSGGAATGAPCSLDDDCACGSCVLGACAPRPGTCIAR